ncbi:MAG TPA: prepilin peptidase, partial [Acetobacteraceae bacterium]|nr:prepilin peptidase [Acetobacteraceae bacterium]
MPLLFSFVSLALLAVAAWRDVAARVIPDAVPAALLLVGLAWRIALAGLPPAGMSLGLALALFTALVALHAAGWLGGGDVKLAAGFAAGLAPQAVLPFLAATAIAGGVLAGLHLAVRGLPFRRRRPAPGFLLWRVVRAEHWRIARHGSLPYGVAIACGGAWIILVG